MARPTLFDILDLANYPGLVEAVATYLDPGSIIALSRSCKALSAIYPHLLCTQWNVDRRLRRFVRDPRGLRAELSQRNALISGGFACQYFDRAVWQESDLDIWANKGDDASGVLVHILREGYILQTQKERDYADDEEPLVGQLAEVRVAPVGSGRTTLTWPGFNTSQMHRRRDASSADHGDGKHALTG